MRLIFYDLETSDLSRLGQILNFSFVATTSDFQVVDELSGKVRIERTILPRAQAILANRIDVRTHQKGELLTEDEAVTRIASFLHSQVEESGKYQVMLVGYNSARFDLKYLQTTFIRNGRNPYGPFEYGDLFFLSQKLYHSEDTYRAKLEAFAAEVEDDTRLSLETVARAHGLLVGEQEHESRSDVMLTIEVARHYASLGCHVAEYRPYEVPKKVREGEILWRYKRWPNRTSDSAPWLLLTKNPRNSLWANLEYAKDLLGEEQDLKGCVKYTRHDEGFFIAPEQDISPYNEVIEAVRSQFSGITISQLFDETTCDIEEHIFRIAPGKIDLLRAILTRTTDLKKLNADQKALFLRYRLRNYEWGGEYDAEVTEKLRAFAQDRYGGECELHSDERYPSFEALMKEVKEAGESASSSKDDKKLMDSLIEFYNESDIRKALEGTK